MQVKGFTYNPLRFTAAQLDEAGPLDETSRAGDDVTTARSDGYGLYKAVPEDTSTLPKYSNPHVGSMSQTERRRWDDALSGPAEDVTVEVPGGGTLHTSSKGCRAEAQRSLYGDIVKWKTAEAMVRNRSVQVEAWVRADSRYTSAVDRWSSCMNKKGYRYKAPEDANRYAHEAFMGKPKMKRKEIEHAVADAECNRDAGVAKAYRELAAEHTRKWVSQHESRVLAVQEMRESALVKAKTLVD